MALTQEQKKIVAEHYVRCGGAAGLLNSGLIRYYDSREKVRHDIAEYAREKLGLKVERPKSTTSNARKMSSRRYRKKIMENPPCKPQEDGPRTDGIFFMAPSIFHAATRVTA